MSLSFNRVMLLGVVASEPRGSERGPGSFRLKTTEMQGMEAESSIKTPLWNAGDRTKTKPCH